MFAVVNTASNSGVNGLFWNLVSTTNTAARVAIFTTPPSGLFWDGGGQANPRMTGLTLTTNTPQLYMFQRSGSTLNYRNSGAPTTSNYTSPSSIASNNYRITMSEAGAAWIGDIHEILWYNRALDAVDIWPVENYLAEKWGLRSTLTSNSPMRFYKPLAPAFNPSLIPGCSLWIDAADYSSFTFSGSNVSQWNDKSGLGYNLTQATGTAQPVWSNNAVVFSGDRRMNIPQASVNNATRWSLVFVFNPISSSNWILAKQFNGVTSQKILSMTWRALNTVGSSNFVYFSPVHGTGGQASTATAVPTGTRSIISMVYNGSLAFVYVNGQLTQSNVNVGALANLTNATNFLMGAWIADSGVPFNSGVTNFQMNEFAFYTSNVDRSIVERYLANKWNIAIPTNHPHYSITV
jgi:hypothetical protein